MHHVIGVRLLKCKIDTTTVSELKRRLLGNRDELSNYLNDTENRIIVIAAFDSIAVRGSGIDLFFNIRGFQAVTISTINAYCDLIKSNRALLYWCNREKQFPYGGETTVLHQYTRGRFDVLFDEERSWNEFFYRLGPDRRT